MNIDSKDKNKRDLGLYIHIPFCVKKCDYCDFLSAPATEEAKRAYVRALITELESYTGRVAKYRVPTVFIGGGTPSSIDADYIREIMETVDRVFSLDKSRLEVTIEVNPGTITEEKLRIYREAGINRLSFGLQSGDNRELALLGRIHTYEEFVENYALARAAGFQNINIDLMSALPGQTLESWENTLEKVLSLNPEHISAYSLIIEEGTRFFERYHDPKIAAKELPDEDTDRLMYHKTKELLEQKGYIRYEISNYAKKGYECRHNCSYWIGTDYLGMGLGASSLLNGARFNNLHDIKRYIHLCMGYKNALKNTKIDHQYPIITTDIHGDRIGLRENYELLTTPQRMEEFMFLGLRLCEGISRKAFCERFGTDVFSVYSEAIAKLVKDNLLEIEDDQIKLTEYGLDVSNMVFYLFLLN